MQVSRPLDWLQTQEGGLGRTPLFREVTYGTGAVCGLVTPQTSLFAIQGCRGPVSQVSGWMRGEVL